MSIALLSLLLLCAQEHRAPLEPPPYPSFEPFRAARMFELVGDAHTVDLAQLRKELEVAAKIDQDADEEGANGPRPAGAPSALLQPTIERAQRTLAPLAPVALMKLERLWSAATWSAADVAEARQVVAALLPLGDVPHADFAADKPLENHAALETLVRWFRAKAARPEWYAAMLLTLDDGPYAGLPLPEVNAPALAMAAAKRLDETTELRLSRMDGAGEPWVLEAVRAGKTLWSRVLSAAPERALKELAFRAELPQRLGSYGWKLRLTVNGGKAQAELYLDAEAHLLFYFVSS